MGETTLSGTLTCFGIGDGVAIADRRHSAYLYTVGGTNVLLDCGEPISRSFKASGLPVDTIDALVISHLHSDHFGGLFMLLQGFWIDRRQKPLPIYMPADGIGPIQQMLRAAYLFEDMLPFRVSFHAIAAQTPIQAGAIRLIPQPTSHLDNLRRKFQAKYPGDYQAFSFALETGDVRVVHSADIGAPADLDPLLAKPVDLLVCELAHAKPETMFAYLKGRPIRHILFTHVARYEWEHLEALRSQAREILSGMNYSFATEGQTVPLQPVAALTGFCPRISTLPNPANSV